MPPKKHVEVESSSSFVEELTGTIAELSATINQMQATLIGMETRLATLETNRRVDNHRDDGENIRNQRDQPVNNVDRDLGIKLVILEYDGKLKRDEFIDWFVCGENIFACKPMTDGHKFTLVAT